MWTNPLTQPTVPRIPFVLSGKNLIRILLVLCLVLSVVAGYYQASTETLRKKYHQLETRYAQVQSELEQKKSQPTEPVPNTIY